MGNKFTFVLLFLSFIIAPIFSQAQTTNLGSQNVQPASNSCGQYASPQYGPQDPANIDCVCNFDATLKFNARQAYMFQCPSQPKVAARTCNTAISTAQEHVVGAGKEIHCVCKFKSPGALTEDTKGDGSTCPKEEKEVVATEDKADGEVEDCIQQVKNQINACKEVATKTIIACDKNSAENAKIFTPINGVIGRATTALHADAVNKGAIEQCRNISLMSASAGYGAGALQKGCSDEISQCKQKCTDEVLAYEDVNNIIEACQNNGGNTSDPILLAKIKAQAIDLRETVLAAKNECGGSNTLADRMLDQAKAALAEMTRASQSAAQCENALASAGAAPTVPLTEHCALNPNSAGCPVNCAYDTGNVQCKCLNNRNDPSCKGSGGNLAAMAGAPYQPVGGATSNFKPGAGAGGGGLGDGLDLGDDSPKAAVEPLKENANDGSMFKSAAAANAGGGGGSGSGSGAGAGGGKGEEPQEKSFLGGTFAALKNAASNLFGGGTTAPKKPSASKDDPLAKNGFKPINPALRGLASNGKACYVDAKGAEYCFGRRNMDIFKMMNSQYSNQYNTLIIDK